MISNTERLTKFDLLGLYLSLRSARITLKSVSPAMADFILSIVSVRALSLSTDDVPLL